MRGYLGVDLGTSGLKATVLGEDGAVRANAEAGYPLSSPRPGWAETDPDVWLRALNRARAALAGTDDGVTAIALCGQMHGVVLADEAGKAVRPAMLWPDRRAEAMLGQWQRLSSELDGRLGPVDAGMAGPMLGWLSALEPESRRGTTVLAPKDWLRGQLTGDRATDRSDASATLLWDLPADTWSAPALALAGVDAEQLPVVRGSAEVVGSTTDDVGVATGGADTACALAAMTAAADAPDALVVNLGSGAQVARRTALPQPWRPPGRHLVADTGTGWYEMVGIRNAGLALAWAADGLGLDWAALLAAARTAQPGAGAVFVPFATGERAPLALAARVGWLDTGFGIAELARAAFEAVTFSIRRSVELLGAAAGPLVLSGGGAREPFVRQLLADCLARPLAYVPLRSASALGAALLAAASVGRPVRPSVRVQVVEHRPDARVEAAYQRWLAVVEPEPRGGD